MLCNSSEVNPKLRSSLALLEGLEVAPLGLIRALFFYSISVPLKVHISLPWLLRLLSHQLSRTGIEGGQKKKKEISVFFHCYGDLVICFYIGLSYFCHSLLSFLSTVLVSIITIFLFIFTNGN